jgi:hypothetical protein
MFDIDWLCFFGWHCCSLSLSIYLSLTLLSLTLTTIANSAHPTPTEPNPDPDFPAITSKPQSAEEREKEGAVKQDKLILSQNGKGNPKLKVPVFCSSCTA